jgi:hypothetical protein
MHRSLWLVILAALVSLGVSAAQGSREPRTVLFFLDDLHIEFRATPRVRELARRLRRQLHENDRVAIMSSGASRIFVTPTTDSMLIDAAFRRMTGNGLTAREFLDARRRADGATDQRRRAAVAYAAGRNGITTAAMAADGRPFAVLYFTSGYDLSNATEPAELLDSAVRAHATIFAIDPRSLAGPPAAGVTADEWDEYLNATRPSLRLLVERTGGIAVFAVQDLDVALARLLN